MHALTKLSVLIITLFAFATTFSYAENNDAYRYKWVGVFVKGSPYRDQVISSAMMWEAFSDVIKKRWKEGYLITELAYGNGKWVGVFSKGAPYTEQAYDVTGRWQSMSADIEKRWKEGYYLVDIEHGLSEWVAVFAKNTGYTNQAFEYRKTLGAFQESVMKRWERGFELVDMEYGQGHWLGIFAQGPRYGRHALSLRSDWKEFVQSINSHWKDGYRLTHVEFGIGKWVGAFATETGYTEQGFEAKEVTEAVELVGKEVTAMLSSYDEMKNLQQRIRDEIMMTIQLVQNACGCTLDLFAKPGPYREAVLFFSVYSEYAQPHIWHSHVILEMIFFQRLALMRTKF